MEIEFFWVGPMKEFVRYFKGVRVLSAYIKLI